MDTLRADELSCYGCPEETTPALDALARRGLLFESAYSTASWTWPATASLLSGLLPSEHGVLDERACVLSTEIETVAEALGGRGYVTAAVTCNPLIGAKWRFDQGFESFDGSGRFRFSDEIVPSVLEWLDAQAGTRFFLYLHLVDTHEPYRPTPEALALAGPRPPDYPAPGGIDVYEKRLQINEARTPEGDIDLDRVIPPAHRDWMRAEYRAAVRSADHYVGLLFERLRALGLEDETVVIFTSDHGEELLDHGYATHGNQLYDELVRVPLIFAGPGVPRGARVATRVSTRHVAPTAARLGGAELDRVEDATDLLRPDELEERAIFYSTHHGLWNGAGRLSIFGIQRGPWVLHHAPRGRPWGASPETDPGEGESRLFNLDEDPRQLFDRAGESPDFTAGLKEALLENLRRTGARRPEVRIGAGAATLKLLEEIGYAGGGG